MGQNFVAADRDQVLLLPPDLRSWLPDGHLALFVIESVEELDLAAFYRRYRDDGWGRPAYDPAMMVALILYAYAKGVRSAREIERRCVEDVAFRVICANLAPDHATIARFRAQHEDALGGLFGQVLGLCSRAGLVRAQIVAIDSTKLRADASGMANLDFEQIAREILEEAAAVDAAEDELYGEARGDELPPELHDTQSRRAWIREQLAELEAEEARRPPAAARDERLVEARRRLEDRHELERRAIAGHLEGRRRALEAGQRRTGRPFKEPLMVPEVPQGRVNVTDPDSRIVKTPRGFIQGYNAHAAATPDQIIVAADVTTGTSDRPHLKRLVDAARRELDQADAHTALEVVLADAGYWDGGQIRDLVKSGLRPLVPPDGHARPAPNPKRRGGLYDQMRDQLTSPEGSALYRLRMATIEPIFGQTKTNRRADHFQRRGLTAARSEWRLITATHNLLKLWRATPATA